MILSLVVQTGTRN